MPPDSGPPERQEDRAWVILTALRDLPSAVLIGGWATWLRTRGPMSHDIDMIVTHAELAQITALADDVSESRHLAGRQCLPHRPAQHWCGSIDQVHVDLYVPHQSRLGARLRIRVERLLPYTETIDGWTVLTTPAHFVTKLAALLDRADSLPGQKDRRELVALLATGIDKYEVIDILTDATELDPAELPDLIHEAFEYLAEDFDSKAERRRLRTAATAWAKAAQPNTPPTNS